MGSIADNDCIKCGASIPPTASICDVCAALAAASQSKVATMFLEKGQDVAIPYRENAQYDLVVRKDKVWSGVQVKTAYQYKGGLIVNTARPNRTGRKPYSPEDVSCIVAVHGFMMWVIPIEDIGTRGMIKLSGPEADGWRVPCL